MKKHQVEHSGQSWRDDRGRGEPSTSGSSGRSDERMTNKEIADRKRAEYLKLHDDDEAELELAR